jgi:uncharacterized repeat protein (TIGR01451 family)
VLGPEALPSGAVTGSSVDVPVPASLGGTSTTLTANWSWTDARGSLYGPVSDGSTLFVELPPEIRADLVALLQTDADADGVPSEGDTVRFAATVHNVGTASTAVVLTVPLDPHTTYVAGSAVSSQGVVTGASDASVVVDLGSVSGLFAATASFDARLGAVPGAVVAVQGTASGPFGTRLTDDPATTAPLDPTWLPVLTTTPYDPGLSRPT